MHQWVVIKPMPCGMPFSTWIAKIASCRGRQASTWNSVPFLLQKKAAWAISIIVIRCLKKKDFTTPMMSFFGGDLHPLNPNWRLNPCLNCWSFLSREEWPETIHSKLPRRKRQKFMLHFWGWLSTMRDVNKAAEDTRMRPDRSSVYMTQCSQLDGRSGELSLRCLLWLCLPFQTMLMS